jgi:hypothetical protein
MRKVRLPPEVRYALTNVVAKVPGYESTRITTAAHVRMGQRRGLLARAVHDDGLVAFVNLLELKSDGDHVREGKEWVVQVNGALVAQEFEVSKAEPFCATLACNSEVFT